MQVSRTSVALIVVLLLLISVSAYFWTRVGLGSPETDSRIANTMQTFVCEKCGYVFELPMSEVAKIRRAQGVITCPKCKERGARKEVPTPRGTSRPADDEAHP